MKTDTLSNKIKEKIIELQETKKNLADKIVSVYNISLSSLSKDDLMEQFSISISKAEALTSALQIPAYSCA